VITASVDQTAAVEGIYRRHLSTGRARLGSLLGGQVEVSSCGSTVTDAAGERYLDCGGYGVYLLGHCHPRVVDAVRTQIERHPMATRLFMDATQAFAAEALAAVTPSELERIYFATSGADAVECALKLARLHGKRRIISAMSGFHGKTFGALSASGNPIFREPFAPLLPNVLHVPFGDSQAIRMALAEADDDCCVILEPVQAEGGVNVPAHGYLRAVADACKANNALLILDEIATGLGRIGAWWAADLEQVVPDIMLVGKPLSGGVVPVSALAATEEVFAPFDRDPFIHSATFAGAPIAMAAVSATIDVLKDERVPERAARLGRRLLIGMREALAGAISAGTVREVRGIGLLLGIEFDSPGLAGDFELELVANRVIPNHCLNQHSVVRLTPPVCLVDSDVSWLLDAIERSAGTIAAHRRARTGRGA
jgi:putrescine aminotransferase